MKGKKTSKSTKKTGFKTFYNVILIPLMCGITGFGIYNFYLYFSWSTEISILFGAITSSLMTTQIDGLK